MYISIIIIEREGGGGRRREISLVHFLPSVALDDHCDDDILLYDADKLTVANWTSLRMRGTCSVNVTARQPSSVMATDNQLMFTVLDLRTPGAGLRITWEQEARGVIGDGQPCPEIQLDIADADTGKMITRACHVTIV